MTLPDPSPPGFTGGAVVRPHWAREALADLLGFGVLALISLFLGLALNRMHRQPLPLVHQAKEERLQAAVSRLAAIETPGPSDAVGSEVREIELGEFQAFVARKGTVIDARAPLFYSQGHVPGAINLPRETFETDYARLSNRLGTRKAEAVAIYCAGEDCHDAHLVAGALGALGFQRLLVYREGWDEWSQSGLPQEK